MQNMVRVQTGGKRDMGKVMHWAIQNEDGTIWTQCGAGNKTQNFYVFSDNDGGGACHRCQRVEG